MKTTRLFAVSAAVALLTACNGGGATPPPFPAPSPKSLVRQPAAHGTLAASPASLERTTPPAADRP